MHRWLPHKPTYAGDQFHLIDVKRPTATSRLILAAVFNEMFVVIDAAMISGT